MKGAYYRWKQGKKVSKMPWVIDYYKNVTDENQYNFGRKVTNRAVLLTGILLFLYGIVVCYVFLEVW